MNRGFVPKGIINIRSKSVIGFYKLIRSLMWIVITKPLCHKSEYCSAGIIILAEKEYNYNCIFCDTDRYGYISNIWFKNHASPWKLLLLIDFSQSTLYRFIWHTISDALVSSIEESIKFDFVIYVVYSSLLMSLLGYLILGNLTIII